MLIEDILWMEFDMDFENFKQTIMDYKILNDASIVQQIFEIDQDLHSFYETLFVESD